MVMEYISIYQGLCMKGNGKTEECVGKGLCFLIMGIDILVCGKIIKCMAEESM